MHALGDETVRVTPGQCQQSQCRSTLIGGYSATAKDVPSGSFASVWRRTDDFRSTPKNRHRHRPSTCLKGANNGSDHFGVLGLRVAAASCHSGKQEQTSK